MESWRHPRADASDHEIFRESIAELDRIVKGSFRTTAVQITAPSWPPSPLL